jgi:hypothetical protein
MNKNNRRQFIKKSFFAGLLGVFAPNLIGKQIETRKITETTTNSKVYYFDKRHDYHRFKEGNFYYRFYKTKISTSGAISGLSAVIMMENENYYWAETPREINKMFDFIKIKNYIIWMEKDSIKVKIIFNYK